MANVQDPGRLLILGAGPTGLGAAWRCQELGFADWMVIEARSEPGGLASSVVDPRGFTWDLGGHVQFSHYDAYDRVLDRAIGPDDWIWHERRAFVRIQGTDVPYPLQHNLHRLPEPARSEGIRGLLEVGATPRRSSPVCHFADWLCSTFGEPLCRIFFWPYNRKVWSHPLEAMAYDWTGERVALPSPAQLLRQLDRSEDSVDWGPNRRFRFPRRGGTGAIWKAVHRLLPYERFRFQTRVVELDLAARKVVTEDGGEFSYDTLLTTIPLDQTIELWPESPPWLRAAAQALWANSVHLVGLGFRGGFPEQLHGWGWIYFPEPQIPPYRVTVFSNYSSAHVPEPGCWSLLAECSSTQRSQLDLEALARRTLEALRDEGLIPAEAQIESVWTHSELYGYPIPTRDRDRALERLQRELMRERVFSRGRFGAWRYEVSNQDHSFMQGVECVDQLCGLGAEPTLSERGVPSATSGERR